MFLSFDEHEKKEIDKITMVNKNNYWVSKRNLMLRNFQYLLYKAYFGKAFDEFDLPVFRKKYFYWY